MVEISEVAARLTEEIPGLLAEYDLPAMAVGICDRSGNVWSAAYGVKARGVDDPVTTRTMFSIQSSSKMYTATAVMLAVQQGLVDLDTPIATYLPEFTVHSRWESRPEERMTLRHLLSHTAGFTHEAPLGGNIDDRDTSFDEHCRSISDTWLRLPVGHHFEYSNLGFDLAAFILQRVSGIPFPEFIGRELFEPLGLGRTTCDYNEILREPDRAIGHWSLVEHLPVRIPMVGAGGVYTSVDDALRYLQFHLTGGRGVLETALLAEMYRVPSHQTGLRFGYGLGVDLGLVGHRFFNHGGGGFGFMSDLAWEPDRGIGVVVLTNSHDHPLQAQFASQLLRELTGVGRVRQQDLPSAAAVEPAALAKLVGDYVGRGGGAVSVVLDAGLLGLIRGLKKQPLRPVGRNEIIIEDEGRERFRFVGDDGSGRPTHLVSLDGGFTRYRNDRSIPSEDASVQTYTVDYLGIKAATITIRRCGDVATLEAEGPWLTCPPLRLAEDAPGLYFCSMGEALDLRTVCPTYANVPLSPETDDPKSSGSADPR